MTSYTSNPNHTRVETVFFNGHIHTTLVENRAKGVYAYIPEFEHWYKVCESDILGMYHNIPLCETTRLYTFLLWRFLDTKEQGNESFRSMLRSCIAQFERTIKHRNGSTSNVLNSRYTRADFARFIETQRSYIVHNEETVTDTDGFMVRNAQYRKALDVAEYLMNDTAIAAHDILLLPVKE